MGIRGNKQEEERQRLLRQVEQLQKETERLMNKPQGSNVKEWTLTGPLRFENLYSTSAGTTFDFVVPMDPTKPTKTSPAEIKIWHDDGRVEVIRCMLTTTPSKKPNEGEAVTVKGNAKAWKFGPDGRPNI